MVQDQAEQVTAENASGTEGDALVLVIVELCTFHHQRNINIISWNHQTVL